MQFKTDSPPELKDPVRIFFGVKFAKTSGNVSLACAVRTADKKIFVEALDCRPVRDGLDWIIAFLRNPHAEKVVIDGAAGAPLLLQHMKDAEIRCKAVLPKVSDVIEVNALFEQNLFAGQICHAAQPSLVQAITNCEHRAIGAGGGFGYASILENADVSLLEAVTLAHWVCANTKEKKKQIITY